MGPHLRWTGLFAVLSGCAASAGASSTIAHLPNVQIHAARVDGAGNIYFAGQTTTSAGSTVAYVARLNSDGTTAFTATLGGSGSSASSATALDIDSAGAVYVTGTTTASDFPVSAGAVQSSGATAFAAKLDAKGIVLYAALIGGNAKTTPGSVAVNSKRELVISGQLTTGVGTTATTTLFTVKLSADGTQVVTGPSGIGGLLAIDAQDNIALAGVPPTGLNGPLATAGAFQQAPSAAYCGCPFLSFPCGGGQFVASLTPDLSQTRFLTYVTAKYGAVPAYVGVDSRGNILIAGTTYAPGYPTTPNSYQPNYTAANGTILSCGPPIPLEYTSPSGYVTLVKADGTGLVFSTFFSGSKSDSLQFAALTSSGIYLAGQASSVDLPGFNGGVPSQCTPAGFVSRMTLDGSAVSASRTPPGTPLAYDSTTGTLLLVSGSDLIRFDLSQATPIACMLDAADLSPVTTVAPGELLAVFGRFSYFTTDPLASTISPANGSFPVKFQGVSVAADQTPSPLLYVSGQQINFQTPYEVAGRAQTALTLTYSDANGASVSDSRALPVSATNPVAFLSRPSSFNQAFPLALNADGTVNSQTQPAAAGSTVTIFVEGLGVTDPPSISGLVSTNPATPLNVPLTFAPYCSGTFCYPVPTAASAASVPGSISGVTQIQLTTPSNVNPGFPFQLIFSLSVGTARVRNTNLLLWVR